MAENNEFIREVNEDYRRDQVADIWRRYSGVIIALAVLLLAALWAARRLRSPLDTIAIVQVAVMTALGWRTLAFPHEMYRIPSLAILSALAVLLLPAQSRPPDRVPQ